LHTSAKKRLGYIGLLLSVRSFVRPIVTLFRLSDTKRNQQKRNERKRNQRNENETKRNQRKQNKINENKTKYDARLLPTHVSVSFIRRGQDLITIEQEYYAFIPPKKDWGI
jgi:hypothetical protein